MAGEIIVLCPEVVNNALNNFASFRERVEIFHTRKAELPPSVSAASEQVARATAELSPARYTISMHSKKLAGSRS